MLSVLIVGGGPTGVEFAGELSDLINKDLMRVDPERAADMRYMHPPTYSSTLLPVNQFCLTIVPVSQAVPTCSFPTNKLHRTNECS